MESNIVPLTNDHLLAFNEHFERHRAESGNDDILFMPFAPGAADGPVGMTLERLDKPLSEPGWERWFVAVHGDRIVGHVDLKGDGLRTGLHRTELGIGIEKPFRRQGLGRRLMVHAIQFARAQETLAWLDLKVFAHNTNARALYRSLGFQELGVVNDRFRIDAQSIDDVLMTLALQEDRSGIESRGY